MSNVFIKGSELDNDEYSIRIDFDRKKGKKIAIIHQGYFYRRYFKIGDVVTINCTNDFGYVYSTKYNKVKVNWGYTSKWEDKGDLLIIPTEYARNCLGINHYNNKLELSHLEYLGGWFKYINGYLDTFYMKGNYLVLGDEKFNIVNSIKYSGEKQYLIDTELNRKITLYKDFVKYLLYKTELFRGDDFHSHTDAFYILDNITKKVYFAGIQDEVKKAVKILNQIDAY